jgi:hypothetical protein
MITIPLALPELHVGAHGPDTGRACIMNAIAYMKGDAQISDMPDCVWGPFARTAQMVNDRICLHQTTTLTDEPIWSSLYATPVISGYRAVHKLCGPCAHRVWMMGVPLIGTAELASRLSRHDENRLLERMVTHIMEASGGALDDLPTLMVGLDRVETLDCVIDGVIRVFGMVDHGDCHYGAYRLMEHLHVFVDWLHEAAGVPVPPQYTVTAEQVAKVPVGVA